MLNRLFKKKIRTAAEILSTGETNWRLKHKILSAEGFPNLLKFISYYESKHNIQIGIMSDYVDELENKCCIFNQVIYNEKDSPALRYNFYFEYIGIINQLSFMGLVTNYWNPEQSRSPKKEDFAHISGGDKTSDLSVEEYERYYDVGYVKAMAMKYLDTNKYKMVRGNGIECFHKMMEKEIREKNP